MHIFCRRKRKVVRYSFEDVMSEDDDDDDYKADDADTCDEVIEPRKSKRSKFSAGLRLNEYEHLCKLCEFSNLLSSCSFQKKYNLY